MVETSETIEQQKHRIMVAIDGMNAYTQFRIDSIINNNETTQEKTQAILAQHFCNLAAYFIDNKINCYVLQAAAAAAASASAAASAASTSAENKKIKDVVTKKVVEWMFDDEENNYFGPKIKESLNATEINVSCLESAIMVGYPTLTAIISYTKDDVEKLHNRQDHRTSVNPATSCENTPHQTVLTAELNHEYIIKIKELITKKILEYMENNNMTFKCVDHSVFSFHSLQEKISVLIDEEIATISKI